MEAVMKVIVMGLVEVSRGALMEHEWLWLL